MESYMLKLIAQKLKIRSIFYGWWIILASSIITTYNSGVLYYGFTAFFTPLINEFGWSRAATSLAFGLYRLQGGLAAPVVGFFIDRLGARRMMMAGVVLVGLGFVVLSRIYSLGSFYAVFLFIALSNSLGFMPVGNYAVAHWFSNKQGIAMGILSGGVSLCGFLVPLLTWIIVNWGWRTAAIAAGVGMWVIGVPLAMIVRDRPEPYGLLPDGETPENNPSAKHDAVSISHIGRSERDFTTKEAMCTQCFWLFSFSVLVPFMANAALFVHEMPFLLKAGIPVEKAAVVVTATVLISGLGRVGFGWMSDRFNRRHLMAIAIATQSSGVMLFASIYAPWHIFAFVILFGIGYGGINPLRTVIQSEYFGTSAFGAIQGILIGIWSTGTMLGPLLAGLFFDVTGDYRKVFMIFGLAALAGIPLILLCKPPVPK
jgi:OFA family oxalate/formate antiporter-like MFS transporter